MPYTIANILYRTKDEITSRCRRILAATPDGGTVDAESAGFLFDLFRHHDEWEQKSAGGIHHISTQTTPHGTRCFVLVKSAGDQIDISFPHAVKHIPNSRPVILLPQALQDFRKAARIVIQAQVFEFRDRSLQAGLRCPFTGEQLTRANCAVDHTPPETFDRLLFEFCRREKLNPLHVHVESPDGTVSVLADESVLVGWQAYHREHANLRLLSRTGNLQLRKLSVSWSELWAEPAEGHQQIDQRPDSNRSPPLRINLDTKPDGSQ